ncbi:MAG: sulfur carrier protein ThiS [Gammaproteobacteria bacterium]|jgi:sulfur carrier protein
MNILLNNVPEKIFAGSTVKNLLENKNIKNKYYAVEINKKIIPKSNHETHLIKDGDKIEIITAIGGG